MNISPERIRVTCPSCGSLFSSDVWRIVDVAQNPDLKRQLLRGRLNLATCPQCGLGTPVATPLGYHDPEKELFLCLLPSELGLSGEQQDKVVGELTNLLMNSLPAEKRKAYLFQPKTFLSMQTFQEEVLLADGITHEMMESQKEKSQLIQELLARSDDEAALEALLEEKKDQVDYDLLLLLTASIDEARQEGDDALVQRLTALRERLQELTQAPTAPGAADLDREMTREELIKELLPHKDEANFKTLVAVTRPLLDYQFFQTLTSQVEAAQTQGEENRAKELGELRSKLLDLMDELNQEARQAMERATKLLRQILESEDIELAAKEHEEEIDGAFLNVLQANIVAAGEAGQEEMAEKLATLQKHVVSLLEARLPPEIRLINRLLSTEGVEERTTLLQEQEELVNDEFLELTRRVAEDLRLQGHQKAADQLAESVKEIEALLQSEVDNADPS